MTRFKPVLATSWSSNANKSVWTFQLRHGVKFHTGRCCMTSDDVKYSLARTMLAGMTNTFGLARFMSKPLQQIKTRGAYTVEFDLGRPQPLFVDQLSSLYMSLILDSKALKAHATKSDPWAHNWAEFHDAGTGPYTIQSWQHGQQVTLVRFPDYWGGWSGKHFSKVVVRSVPEEATRRELVERGQADLVGVLTPQDYDQLSHNSRVRVVLGPTTQVNFLVMTEAGPLASPYARQALSYAFPYNAYLQAAYRSHYAKRAYGPLASTLLGYDPHMFHYQTDLNKAKALLAKAGVKPGTTLTFTYVSGLQNFQIAGELLQAQLQQLGINLKLQVLDETTFDNIAYGNTPPSKRPNLMDNRWWPDFNDPYDEANTLINSADAGSTGANFGFYHNKQADALLAAMKTADQEALVNDAAKLQDITSRQDPPAIWTDEPAQTLVLARSLKGLVINPVEIEAYDFYRMHR
jgi:peptide/nickel transport system substrate-binding protein